ncbi:MAG: Uma2 family endonuclease [Kofleriaceae bacterium]
MNQPAARGLATLADLLAIPEEYRRHEVIDGALVEKDAASGRHGAAQGRLFRRLGPYDRRPGGRWPGGWWFATEVEIQLADTQVFRPDVAGWRREHLTALPAEVPISVIPDWICEILSTNKRNDLIKKKRAYHQHHVAHYWLVDPVDETLAVHRWHPEGYLEVLVADRDATVRAEPFDAIDLRVGVLFGDDDDDD